MQYLAARVDDARGAALLFGQDDLREGHLREVGAVVAVDDLDLVSAAHELRDFVQRDVATRASVVELAVRVLLDKVSFGGCRQRRPILTRRVKRSAGFDTGRFGWLRGSAQAGDQGWSAAR